MGLDEKLCLPFLEMYMEHSSGSLIIANIPRRPALIIRDRVAFNMPWCKIESYFHFLMGWRMIFPMVVNEWIVNFLNLHNAYIHPRVVFDRLDNMDFCTPNIEKMIRRCQPSSFLLSSR